MKNSEKFTHFKVTVEDPLEIVAFQVFHYRLHFRCFIAARKRQDSSVLFTYSIATAAAADSPQKTIVCFKKALQYLILAIFKNKNQQKEKHTLLRLSIRLTQMAKADDILLASATESLGSDATSQ